MMEQCRSIKKACVLLLQQILDCLSLMTWSIMWQSQYLVTTAVRSVACVATLMATKKMTSDSVIIGSPTAWMRLEHRGRSPSLVFRVEMAVEGETVLAVHQLTRLYFQSPLTVALQQHPTVLLQSAIVNWTQNHTLMIVCLICVLQTVMERCCATA